MNSEKIEITEGQRVLSSSPRPLSNALKVELWKRFMRWTAFFWIALIILGWFGIRAWNEDQMAHELLENGEEILIPVVVHKRNKRTPWFHTSLFQYRGVWYDQPIEVKLTRGEVHRLLNKDTAVQIPCYVLETAFKQGAFKEPYIYSKAYVLSRNGEEVFRYLKWMVFDLLLGLVVGFLASGWRLGMYRWGNETWGVLQTELKYDRHREYYWMQIAYLYKGYLVKAMLHTKRKPIQNEAGHILGLVHPWFPKYFYVLKREEFLELSDSIGI